MSEQDSSPRLTQCPRCATRFQVSAEQLAMADGRVRCGACLHIFDAIRGPEQTPSSPQRPDNTTTTPAAHARPPAGLAHPEPPAVPSAIPTAPVSLRARPDASHRRPWVTMLLCLTAGGILLAQVAWNERQYLAFRSPLAPWYQAFCQHLTCRLPPPSLPERIVSRQLVTQPHPNYQDALVLNLQVENQAGFAQPFPLLEINFFDFSGTLQAQRRFRPDEYLTGELRQLPLMPPYQPIQLRLELLKPSPQAVNYQIQFLPGGQLSKK